MKTKILLSAFGLLGFNAISQNFVSKVWENQNVNLSNYDIVSTALDNYGNIISTANNLMGSNTRINVRCMNHLGNINWSQNFLSSIPQNDYGVDVKTDASGNSYICGATHNGTNYDYSISKYDLSGSQIWQKIYNGIGNSDDIPAAIELDNSGNVYVTGTSYAMGLLNTDYVTIKYDNNGNQIWLKRYDYLNKAEIATDLLVDNSGNVFVTGASASSINNSDITTLKYNSSGTLLNTHRHNYPGNGYNIASEMNFDNSNNILITGSFENGSKKFGTLKLSNTLTQLWFNTISGSMSSEGYGIYSDNSSNVISVGYQNNSNGGSNIIINKYDASGSLLWNKTLQNINPSNFAKARKVKTDAAGNIFVISDAVLNTTKDFLTQAFDANGNNLWEKYYNSTTNSNDVPNSILLKNNEVIVTGISTLASSKTISTVKYKIDTKPLIASSTSSGNYNKNELLIWFDTSHVIKSTIDKKDFQSGRLMDFIKPDFFKVLNGKINIGWEELKTFKVYTRMTTADTISISRTNDKVKIPSFWATLSVMLPTTISEQQVKDSLNTLYKDIKEVDYNYIYTNTSIPNDQFVSSYQAGLIPTATYPNANINMNQAWDYEVGNTYAKVGVFDDVIYWAHEDFGNGTLAGSKIAGGYDYVNATSIINTTNPGSSHGTACAGIIGALRNNNLGIAGIAGGDVNNNNTGASLYSMGIASGGSFATSAVIRNAIVEGASYSPSFGFGLHIQSHSWGSNSDDYKTAIEYAALNGCILSVSRGNDGLAGNPATYPSCSNDDYVISVGASGFDGKHKNASNGDVAIVAWESNYGNNMDIIAPGCTEIVSSTYNPSAPFWWTNTVPSSKYYTFNGTSAAAPHVSGVAALMVSKHNNGSIGASSSHPQNLICEDIEHIMQNTAIDIVDASYPAGYDAWNGYGRLNAFECVRQVNYPEYEVSHYYSSQANSTTTLTNQYINVPNHITSIGVAAGNYFMDVVTVDAICSMSKATSQQMISWWPLNSQCFGTDASNPLSLNTHYQQFTTTPVVSGPNSISAGMRAFCYFIKYDIAGNTINKWYPCEPWQVTFRYAVHLKDNSFVGIKENKSLSNGNISIYPNPTNNIFYIQASDEYKMGKNDKYEIYSLSGQLVYTDKIVANTTTVDINNLSDGIYIIKTYINNSVSINKVVKNN